MLKQISGASCRSSIHAALLLSGLLAFVVAANGWLARVAAASDVEEPVTDATPNRVNPFDSEVNMTGSPAGRRECTSVASVRWLPHSTLTIAYARGDFTEAERRAFHKAVSLWQRALAQTDVGIVLEESGEIDRDLEPARSQIVVKRDHSMDSRYYGKIVASARPDNYVERATILINGSLHKRSSLRKTLLHELGHGFGLRDCPDCRSGATVMNYFSQQLLMGFKIRRGNKISDQPTACDISQINNGYRQSPPPMPENGEDEAENRTIVADEMVALPAVKSSNSDDNIIAPYLRAAAPSREANAFTIASYLKLAGARKVHVLAVGPDLGTASVPRADAFAFASDPKPVAAKEVSLFAIGRYPRAAPAPRTFPVPLYLKPALVPVANTQAIASYLKPTAAREVSTLAIGRYLRVAPAPKLNTLPVGPYLKLESAYQSYWGAIGPHFKPAPSQEAKAFEVVPYLKPASVPEVNIHAIDEGVRKESVLTDAEKTEFEAYIPTLLGREAETMMELNNYTFRRDLRIQTIDSKGRVSGEYRRISDMVFDDSGARIERGLSVSESTLRRLKVSPQYVEDFSGVQLKGFELSKRDHYRVEPFMEDAIDGVRMRVYRMTPLNLKAERAANARVFYGFIWVDEKTGKIFKIAGCALPDDKQRYPLFETQRALIDGAHLFPAHTVADDYLMFPSHTVHVRMLITYTNYKRFASRVTVTEVDGN